MNWKRFVLPALLFILVGILIFYRYTTLPKQLAFDEIEFAKIALSLDNKSYVPYVDMANGHSTLYFYVLLLSLKLFGLSTFALRLPSALFAVGAVLLFYAVLQKLLKHDLLAFTGAAILTTQRWFYTFARFSFEATFLLFLELVSLYFLVGFLQQKKGSAHLYLSAVFAGLAFHSYQPGRIFFVVPLLFVFLQAGIKPAVRYLAIFTVVAIPLIFSLLTQPDTRISQLSYITDRALTPVQKTQQFGQNVVSNTLQFYTRGDMNGRHNYPGKAALNPIIALLFTLGFLISLRNRKDWIHQLFLAYFFIAALPPLLVYSHDNPNMLRSFTILPSVAYFSLVAVRYGIYKTPGDYRFYKALFFLTILGLAAVYDARTYFVYQSDVARFAFEVLCRIDVVLPMKPDNLGDIPQICRR